MWKLCWRTANLVGGPYLAEFLGVGVKASIKKGQDLGRIDGLFELLGRT